jgi:hypothetical protein
MSQVSQVSPSPGSAAAAGAKRPRSPGGETNPTKQSGAIGTAALAAAAPTTTGIASQDTQDNHVVSAGAAQPAPLTPYVVVYRDGRNQLVLDGPLGDVLAGRQPFFTYGKREKVRVVLTQRDGTKSVDWERDVIVGWSPSSGSFCVGMPMHQPIDHGLPVGNYTSPSTLGQTTAFEPDLFAEVLADLAKMDITLSERRAALATYVRILKDACKHVPLSIIPKTFNVLAAVPALDVGFDKATQEFLVGLVRDMLGHLLESVLADNPAWFLEDFKAQLLPTPFEKALMHHKEYRFRLELVGAVRMAFGA